ncbi:MAG: ABC transporter ATP-binding protein [Nitrospiraceae bacterium]|nr:ABC transporter ATP-binding protein [Nitrospiraceae bacterium]
MIETKGLQKTFKHPAGELNVLKGIDLRIEDGEMVAVVGASGVGKSTLLHILGTLDRPSGGTVLFDGIDVFKLPEKALTDFRNRQVGFVFQFHHLLPEFTALENVMMPGFLARPGVDRARLKTQAEKLLAELGLAGRACHRPGEMSGGEQQRVAVARALVQNPSVILADEPTGNLDTRTGKELFDLLYRLNAQKGITFVIATHDKGISGRCGRIVSMTDGRIDVTENGLAPRIVEI